MRLKDLGLRNVVGPMVGLMAQVLDPLGSGDYQTGELDTPQG